MFVRRLIVKGHLYYQVVETIKRGDEVRQRLVEALGREPDPAKALRRMKVAFASIPNVFSYPAGRPNCEVRAARIAHEKRKARLQERIATLGEILKKGLHKRK